MSNQENLYFADILQLYIHFGLSVCGEKGEITGIPADTVY